MERAVQLRTIRRVARTSSPGVGSVERGGSGAFVSADGLMVTNQHVASGQLQKVSTREKDYTKEGFYAQTDDQELKCPDLECNVLVSYEDVTARVQSAV